MASVLSHPAVPLSLSLALGSARVPPALAAAACAASVLPDIDSLGFAAGIPYGHPLGHRGFTHSISFALLAALAAAAFARRLGSTAAMAFALVFVSAASHGLLDALTTGGLGVAFFSPFSNRRYFFPWRPILVSPIGIVSFVSERGLRVLSSELAWIWLPAGLVAAAGVAIRRIARLG
ncbi:MAG TPA: metal-dependent hydrolase [Thermoanaerobaculia bacterium]|nr:metal-dependent hydrolase [Thermoanaerobaculia bacterium]